MKSAPINAVKDGAAGAVELVQCASRNLRSLCGKGSQCAGQRKCVHSHKHKRRGAARRRTPEEKGIRAKLIQSNDDLTCTT